MEREIRKEDLDRGSDGDEESKRECRKGRSGN